ncbi:hypothetical protein RvY_07500 [Ramazzottius varieornatus]|uniref:Uncharacterized protein n=1 Tax=Ramazzottius varieornatus TaxID=947166 RepID=A0A1D1V2F0_RAMVA|nr:hypothetical protein RvY_07500 [Ramazzottius varieornatus]
MSTNTAYMFWDMNSCRITSTDNAVLDIVQKSFLELVENYGCTSAVLRGYCNFHDYRLLADEIWALGQYNVQVQRFFDSPIAMEAEIELLARILRDHPSSPEGSFELPLFLTSGNLELIWNVYTVNPNMVLCTSLTPTYPIISHFIRGGLEVYEWDPSSGVGQRYS